MEKKLDPGTKVRLLKDIPNIDIDGGILEKAGEIVEVADWNDWTEEGIVVGNEQHSFLVEDDEYEVVGLPELILRGLLTNIFLLSDGSTTLEEFAEGVMKEAGWAKLVLAGDVELPAKWKE